MKKATILFSLFLVLFGFKISQAQIFEPVEWEYIVENRNGNEATLVFKANIDKGWHVYTQNITDPMGPIPTTFTFKKSDDFELLGKPSEMKKARALAEAGSNLLRPPEVPSQSTGPSS